MSASVEISDARCIAPLGAVLGEGPLYDPREGALYSLDIKGEKIFRTNLATEETEAINAPGKVSALALSKSGGLVCAKEDGFARLNIEKRSASFTPIVDPEKELHGNRFNDGKADPLGGFWAGTMDNAEKNASGSWWRLAPDGAVTKIDGAFHITNGPAFDPERGRVYLTDSATRTVFVAKTDGASISNKRAFLQFGEGDGYPDGMEVDAEGCLWIAFWDGWSVRRFSPNAELLLEAALPVPRPTSVAFVEDSLFVTSALIGLDSNLRNHAPLSGGLFHFQLSRGLERPAAFFGDFS